MENGKERILASSQSLSRSNRYNKTDSLERSKSGSAVKAESGSKKAKRQSGQSGTGRNSTALKWVFRLVIVPFLCLLMVYIGIAVGYVVIGKGELSDALSLKPLIHVYQLVFG